MTVKLYLTPLIRSQTTQPQGESASANLSIDGLVQQAGLSTQRISTQNVDIAIRGKSQDGEFSKKIGREIRSLGESDIEALPFDDDTADADEDKSGYYEVSDVSVNRAHESTSLAYQYEIGLTVKGTRETEYRAVRTNSEAINTGLTGGATDYIGIPAAASKARWFDISTGTETATVQETVTAEFGDVDRYDPAEPSFSDPTLIYALPFRYEGLTDVRVWDDRGLDKYVTYTDDGDTVGSSTVGSATVTNSETINQWIHVYHPGYEYRGKPVIDNGLFRLSFDLDRRRILGEEFDDFTGGWNGIDVSHADYWLFDFDVTAIGPSQCEVFVEFEDRATGSIDAATLHVQRGIDRAVARDPINGDIPGDLETMLDPLTTDTDDDPQPSQGVISKTEVK